MVALLAEGVDRNSFAEVEQVMNLQSLSSRRAWIEIAPTTPTGHSPAKVALLAEGVDRNSWLQKIYKNETVALLAEGVDRNGKAGDDFYSKILSLSSRRAWIEIRMGCSLGGHKDRRSPRGGRG